ncbi:MAG: hypothetical protein ACFFAN_04315, partial [Promethearchaeota archaeon]
LAVWISIELNKLLKNEIDFHIKEDLIYSINKIKKNFKDIDKNIQRVNSELNILNKKINEFRKIPAQFRKKLNSYIRDFKFNETELELNRIYNRIKKKIIKFHTKINNFEYKRLAFDLIEEWEETKVQIIDELSIIKSFISEICKDKKEQYISDLKNQILLFEDRINVLSAQFDYIKQNSFNNSLENLTWETINKEENLEEKFAYITLIRKSLFKLDIDLRELLIHNLEFDDLFKDLIRKWIKTKIKIQEYLSELDLHIKMMKEKIVINYFQIDDNNEKLKKLSNELAFQLLQAHIQSVISHGTEVIKRYNDNFNELNSKLALLIKKKEFANVRKIMDMKSTQIKTFISETENQIDHLLGKEKIFQDNDMFNLFVRPYIDKWNASTELVINKLKYLNRKYEDKLYLSQIKYYLKIMNPINLNLLSSYVGLEKEQLKELILKYLKKNKLNAKIANNFLYSQKINSYLTNDKNLLFFKHIKTTGNKIYLYFKLSNPSNHNFKDLQISLKIPSYLKFLKKHSFPQRSFLSELKPGNILKFNYILKISRQLSLEKDLSDPRVDEIKLDLYYRDPFNIPRKTTKKINLLLP